MHEELKTKQCFIFDMDGTLVNLEELNKKGYQLTIKKFFDIELSHDDYQKYFSGTRTAEAFNGYLKSKNISDYNVDELIKDFRTIKEYELINNTKEVAKLIDGAREYLEQLKSQNKTIILATSTIKKFVDIILGKFEIIQYFDHIVTAEDVTKGKPDPEIFNIAQDKSQREKESCVVFEDSKNGINAALASEMLCIGIHTKGLNDDFVDSADYVISNYKDLI